MRDYLPRADEALANWTANFAALITLDPAAYGLAAPDAVAYAAKQAAYQAALAAAINPSTRGLATVFAKNNARGELLTLTRQTAMQVQRTMNVTDEQRQALGLTVRKSATTIPSPSAAPRIGVVGVEGRVVTVRLHHARDAARRKPDGVLGATLFSFIGPTPSPNVSDWKFEGSTTDATAEVTFDESVPPGTRVWFTAFWYNPRGQRGPASEPVGATIQFGGMGQFGALSMAA